MAVTIKNAPGAGGIKDFRELHTPTGTEITTEQFEIFGRLRLNQRIMAAYLRVQPIVVDTLMRRSDYKQAYEAGRAETIIAARQKELSLGLAGDTRVLKDVVDYYGEREQVHTNTDVEASKNSREWDAAVLERAKAARDKLLEARKNAG